MIVSCVQGQPEQRQRSGDGETPCSFKIHSDVHGPSSTAESYCPRQSRTALLITRVREMLKRCPMSESCRVVTAKWNQSCGRRVRKSFSTRMIRKWSIVEMREWTAGPPKHSIVLRSRYDKSVKNGGLQTLQCHQSTQLEMKAVQRHRERF